MAIREDELISRKLKICENCEWCCYHGEYSAKCILDNKEKGIFDICEKFKKSTGNHFTIYY